MNDTENNGTEQSTWVYVVATCHPDDPHPKVEGVYRRPEDAEKGKREAMQGLGAAAAEVYEMEVR